jgi:hypothetical protein
LTSNQTHPQWTARMGHGVYAGFTERCALSGEEGSWRSRLSGPRRQDLGPVDSFCGPLSGDGRAMAKVVS